MLDAFRPNRTLTGRAWGILLFVESVLFIGLWILGDDYLIPGPLEVARSWWLLVKEQGLLHEIIVSLKVNAQAITISAVVSVGFSYSTVLPFMRPIVQVLSNLRFFGLTGFMIVIIMMVGGGHTLKVSLLVFGMSPFFLTSMASVIGSIPKSDYDQARSLRMTEWRTVREVVVRGTADQAFEVLRQNAAIGWMMLTIVEGQNRSGGGIGAMMLNQEKHRLIGNIFAIQATIFIFGIFQDKILTFIKNIVCPYAKLTLERK